MNQAGQSWIADRLVARFEISFRACLDPEGRPLGPLPGFAEDIELLQSMYRMMVRARAFDTKAIHLQRTGKLGTYPSCLGHEAAQIGIGAAMHPDDVLFTVYREIGIKFWRGVELLDILLYWGGDERGTYYRNAPQDFPFCVPIGSQMPHAAGAALAMQIRGEGRCAVACIGDGGTSQGAFYEALNLAGAKCLPLVCVVINNGWAISVPVAAQTAARTLAQKAIAAGIPALQIDGNDVLIVRDAVGEAVERARRGAGPTLIEALTYRLNDHTTSDDSSRYRATQEVEAAREHEPVRRMRAFLQSRQWWDEEREEAFKRQCSEEIETAVKQYLATPKQSTDSMFDYLYAQLPPTLRAQREEARRFAAPAQST